MTGRRTALWIVGLGFLVGGATAHAQRGGPPQTKDLAAPVTGKMLGMQGTTLYIGNPPNQLAATVYLTPQTKTSVSGSADPDFLQKGLYVQFSAMVGKDKRVDGAVKDLMVCDINDTFQPGMTPEGGPDALLEYQKNPDKPIKCLVRGQIRNAKDGEIQVFTSKETVTATIAPDAKISVSVSNLQLAREGDEVKVTAGKEAVQPQGTPAGTPKMIQATRIEVTGSSPFTGPAKKGKR